MPDFVGDGRRQSFRTSMNNRRYRIVSDGSSMGTKVLDPDGRSLDMVTKVEWSIEAGRIGVARVTLFNVEVDVVGDEPNQSAPCPAGAE